MIIERKPIEFDEDPILSETLRDLANDYHLLGELIGDKVTDELCDYADYEQDHVTDLLVEKIETILLKVADKIASGDDI